MDLPSVAITKMAAQIHPQHLYHKCRCHRVGCQFCDGGLGLCEICGGFEGSLATDCPGIRLTEEQQDAIYKDGVDFKDGEWVNSADGQA